MLMCCLSCAKVDWCKQADRVEDYCVDHEERPMTNADRIRAMSDEELARLIVSEALSYDYICPSPLPKIDCAPKNEDECIKCWLWWLKEEVSDAKTD